MENKPFIAVVCGEIEAEKEALIEKISAENNMTFISVINPETDCHPKKQSLSAENWARHISVKHWNVILTTNSFHYLEAFLFYLKKYDVDYNIHFYLAENGNVHKSDNPYDVMKNLSQPTFDLEEEELEYELEPEPVKHGTWIRYNGENICSECHCCNFTMTFYCPRCGAKMDGGA